MKGFPTELIFVALLGAALLFNLLMQRAAKRRQAEATQHEPMPDEIPEEVWREVSGRAAATPPPEPRPARPRRAEMPASPARARRRFARQTLLGTKRQVQDAFVVATILGRCRGDEPHEIR